MHCCTVANSICGTIFIVELGRFCQNTKLKKGADNSILFQLMNRAETWLENNSFTNPIYKWETKEWGEIPADFGRK